MAKEKGMIIISTFSTKESCSKVARAMVEKRLCACVNYTKVHSIYSWIGKVEDHGEYIALFKTTNECTEKLKVEIAKLHPYEVPEIIQLKMSDVSKPYLSWLIGSTDGVAKNCHHSSK